MFSWPLRIAGWSLAALSLLKLWLAAGYIQYQKLFLDWFLWLEEIVTDIPLDEVERWLILPALDYIRSFDIPIPELQDHWQQLFVLTWLLSASWARNLSFGVSTPVALGLAFFCTLPFCIAAGTMSLGSGAVLYWPIAGFSAFIAILALLPGHWRVGLLFAAIAAAIASYGFFFATSSEDTRQLFKLAVSIGFAGLMSLVLGLLSTEGTLSQRLQHSIGAVGLDITAAMLWAFGLATVFADPPLF